MGLQIVRGLLAVGMCTALLGAALGPDWLLPFMPGELRIAIGASISILCAIGLWLIPGNQTDSET